MIIYLQMIIVIKTLIEAHRYTHKYIDLRS